MSDEQIQVGTATDARRYLASDQTVWFEEQRHQPVEEQLEGLPAEQRFAADVPGSSPETYPGIYGVFSLELAVPAGDGLVPCAGLTWVGVHPDHRRRGILTAMLRDHFRRVHDQSGVAISALHASEPGIYGRHGYGLASLELEVQLGRGTTLVAPHLDAAAGETTTELVTITDPAVPARLRAVTRSVAGAGHGAVVGGDAYFRRVCRQPAESLRDKEPERVLFARRRGADIGYALLRRTQKWERGRPAGRIAVSWITGPPEARLALLRRLLDFDLIGTVEVDGISVDDPLLHWVGGPRGAQDVATYDNLWVRLVDLPEALRVRSYAARCDVVLEVEDDAAPWNHGTWRFVVDDAGAAVIERSAADADLRLPVRALGAAFLGGANLASMSAAGHVQEARPGASLELWRAMRTDTAPLPAMGF